MTKTWIGSGPWVVVAKGQLTALAKALKVRPADLVKALKARGARCI